MRKANVDLLQAVDRIRPDLILVIATSGVRAGTLAQAQVLSPRTRVYMIYPDSPHGLSSDRIACLPVCHRVAVSSSAWSMAFKALGARQVHYLPFAADPDLHSIPPFAEDSATAIRFELGFIGTWRPEREALLERMDEFNLAIWGGKYWSTRTNRSGRVRNRWAGGELIGPQVVAASAETAVMLNILDPITWPGPNMRSFELPACRAFVLSSRSPAILEIFEEGRDLECFDSPEEAIDKVRFYLTRSSDRIRIAQNGYERVIGGGHTYVDRAKTIVNWFDEDV
jgi:spore maturation protein CgeB